MTNTMDTSGVTHGAVRVWLRVEGAVACLAAGILYARGGHSWLLFGALFLIPDVSFAGYLAGPRTGAATYNLAHSYVGPALLALTAFITATTPAVALVWIAHIGFDRALGYGLKYPTAFRDTHLGRLGRRASHGGPSRS